jgi:alkylhydroperoxidase/carboxymuconolactone decarboxylase family protein YurZ
MKALLAIAGSVQKGGKNVTDRASRKPLGNQGATDKDIHDAVLIAAAFCMFNRYVDGLATVAPVNPEVYTAPARQKWLKMDIQRKGTMLPLQLYHRLK